MVRVAMWYNAGKADS
jgi:hypothetical protein